MRRFANFIQADTNIRDSKQTESTKEKDEGSKMNQV